MLVVLRSDVPLAESEFTAGEEFPEASDLTDLLSTTVGAVAVGVGVCFAADVSATVERFEGVRIVSGSRGWRSFFSLIVITIFSRSSGVMCLSRPLLLMLLESCR